MYRRDLRDTTVDHLLAELAVADSGGYNAFIRAGSDGGPLVYALDRSGRPALWVSEGGGPGRRLTGGDVVANPWGRHRVESPWFDLRSDGARVAYVATTSGHRELHTADVATGKKRRLTTHDAPDGDPRYAPDGSALAFVTDYWSPGSLGVVSADGSTLECLRDDEYVYADPQWLDTETMLAVRTEHWDTFDNESEIVRVSRSGALEVLYAEPGVLAFGPRPRPGTDEFAFVHEASGCKGLYLDGPGRDREALFVEDGVEAGVPAWDATADRVATAVSANGASQWYIVPVEGEPDQASSGPAARQPPAWRDGELLGTRSTPTRPLDVRNVTAGESIHRTDWVGFEERLTVPESVRYESVDETEIQAHLYLPDGIETAAPDSIPLVVSPHGGPTAVDEPGFDVRAQYFSALGYAVVKPNYRGSEGFGRAFRDGDNHRRGRGDVADVVTAVEHLDGEYGPIDGGRAGIVGGSAGGQLTVKALAASDRFAAGAALAGVYDYETFVDDTDEIGWRVVRRELGLPATDLAEFTHASPIEDVPDIDAPLLLLHGEADERVPISQSEQLAAELDAHGKRYELQRYADAGHGFTQRETVVDAYTRIADLFAKYLRTDPDDRTSRPRPPQDADRSSSLN